MIELFQNLIFGGKGISNKDIEKLVFRHKFSKFLPWRVYDPATQAYFNMDDSVGYLWECIPLVYANRQVFGLLEGLLNQAFPENTVLQFILYADPRVKPILERYKYLKVRQNELSLKATNSTGNFFQTGTMGLAQLQGIPVRNFRLFVALKLPGTERVNEFNDIRNGVFEILKGINLYPQGVDPRVLINLAAQIFNGDVPDFSYDPDVLLNEQMILSETAIKTSFSRIKIGGKYWGCQTVKKMAERIDNLTFNFLNGDIWGVTGDANQITNPFILTVNVIFQNLAPQLHRKCNFVLQQKAIGSLAPNLLNKQDEYTWATGELEKGIRFVRVMPVLWHQADTAEELQESAARVKRIWQSRSFVPQEDRGILKMLFLSALPFGLYTDKRALDFIERDFIAHPSVVARCLPIQADFMGGGDPHCLFVGRKGQLVTFDLFAPFANNSNALIAATTGAGKSFLVNTLAFSYYMSGAKIRIVDIGRSYAKLCNLVDGQFIHFTADSRIVLNPFSNIVSIDESIRAVSATIAQMIFSTSYRIPSETEMSLIKSAIRNVYHSYGNQGTIDHVYRFLASPTKSLEEVGDLECSEDDDSCVRGIKQVSTEMAFNLRNFTTSGEYGRWFNGPSTLNIAEEDFVVLELEELKKQPELFNVVTLQLLDYVTSDLYLSEKSDLKRMIIFDEAWQFFNNNGREQSGNASFLGRVIEEGYRRARKYGGSFSTVVQSLLDFEIFGDIGQVILSNSAYKFMLQSSDFEKAKRKDIIDYGDFMMDILKSITSPKPRYSEIFMDTPIGTGVARLVVDPFMYYVSTSAASENALIENLVKTQGCTYAEAIEHLIGRPESS